jgi:mannose-6-phosphate isomerase-like protein (cupin superfamily)
MPIERKKTLNVFRDAREAWGSYDDFPVGQPGTDPMPHLSRNRVAQPFYLVSEADQVLIQMAGRGEILLRDTDAEDARLVLEPGDTVYIPACVPSRLIPHGENVQIRLKAEPAVREAVAWYCACGALVSSAELAPGIMQEGYLAAVQTFNASARQCSACERVHPPAELGDIDWAATAAAVRASL